MKINSTRLVLPLIALLGAASAMGCSLFGASSGTAGSGPVDLGSAGNYVILAKTGVSNVPTSAITGDIGISPAAESFMTGFSQTKNTGYSTCPQVTGFMYAADSTPPTPANLTTAISDMLTAYNDAAGRSANAILDQVAGIIGGSVLTPGLYKWNSSVTIPTDMTIQGSGGSNDIWIFQVTGNLDESSSVTVFLTNGAQAKNIFWQVAGQATLGTTAAMKGNILCQTQIAMSTGATLDGRALAQTAVTLNANTIKSPAVTSVPNGVAPQKFELSQNYPNPFNPSTVISYQLPVNSQVTLKVYNVLGQEVATLVSGRQEAGSYSVPFNTNKGTRSLSSGVYIYRLQAGSLVSVKKLVLLK